MAKYIFNFQAIKMILWMHKIYFGEEYHNITKIQKSTERMESLTDISSIFTYTRNMRTSLTFILIHHLKHISKNAHKIYMLTHCCTFTFPPIAMFSLYEKFVSSVPYVACKMMKNVVTITWFPYLELATACFKVI
jgi:hypothetical protein